MANSWYRLIAFPDSCITTESHTSTFNNYYCNITLSTKTTTKYQVSQKDVWILIELWYLISQIFHSNLQTILYPGIHSAGHSNMNHRAVHIQKILETIIQWTGLIIHTVHIHCIIYSINHYIILSLLSTIYKPISDTLEYHSLDNIDR